MPQSALVILTIIVLAALAAPGSAAGRSETPTDPANRLAPLFGDHLLGSDALGRDVLSRLVWGTRVSLAVGLSASLIAAMIGSSIGLIAGYFGGRTDSILMRFIDLLMAFPYILLALAIVAVLGPGLVNALYAIAAVNIPFFARNIRGITIGLSRREFVDAARLSGKGHLKYPRHGNSAERRADHRDHPVDHRRLDDPRGPPAFPSSASARSRPQADLGSMLGDGRKLLFTVPLISLVPGLAIFLVVMSINLLGDGNPRTSLDPRLRSGALARPSARTAIAKGPRRRPNTTKSDDSTLAIRDLRTKFRMGSSVAVAVGGVDLSIGRGEMPGARRRIRLGQIGDGDVGSPASCHRRPA